MTQRAVSAYRGDLAYIHDAGFGNFARTAAPWLLKVLGRMPTQRGLVIDLGCGSGIWAEALVAARYEVLGFDVSEAMLTIARQRVPSGEFRGESFLSAELLPCVAVTALGEVFNYQFDARNTRQRLQALFRRIYAALCAGGQLIFDVAEPGRVPKPGHTRKYTEGTDWACLYAATEDRRRMILSREITTFRKVGELYHRDHEVHRLRLFDRAELLSQLREIGFRVRLLRGYGEFRFPSGWVGFLACKP